MKASIFIKTSLVDQMQQIADLGLWFHLAKLIPSGVEVLARVRYAGPPFMYDGNVFLPETIERVVGEFYKEFAPRYNGLYPTSKDFFSVRPNCFLTSDPSDAEKHISRDENGMVFIHVPQWFYDFKSWCEIILEKIEAGNLEDIEVLKMGDAIDQIKKEN